MDLDERESTEGMEGVEGWGNGDQNLLSEGKKSIFHKREKRKEVSF